MIKGAFVFAAGLATGTVYGIVLGVRWTKGLEKIMASAVEQMNEKKDEEQAASSQTVPGETVSPSKVSV